ncbi:MAG: hypothetical protein ACT4PI_05790 [Actinomycetota bacterium]
MRRGLVIVLVAVIASVALPAAPAAAGTTVDPNGNVVTITIPIDVVGAEDKTSPDGTMSLVDYWEKILNDTWGAAFDTIPYKNCYRFELKLKLTAQGRDFDSTKGRHRILVGAPTGGLTFDGTGFDGTEETSRNHATGDGTRSLEHDRDGAIPVDAPPTVIAHEFGHLFGLGQDSENGAPKSGHDLDDVMVGGVPGADLTRNPDIDKKVIDRIGKIIERYLKDQNKKPLPKCQTWKGPINGSISAPGCSPTNPSVEGDIEVGVVRNRVVGTGSWVEQAYSCGGTTVGPFDLSFPITGTKTDDQFNLELGPDALSMTIVDSTASGSFEVFGAGGFGSSLTFTLTRENGEAVG